MTHPSLVGANIFRSSLLVAFTAAFVNFQAHVYLQSLAEICVPLSDIVAYKGHSPMYLSPPQTLVLLFLITSPGLQC
jgi:hypothetical protein